MKVDITVSVEFQGDGRVKLTFGPVDPEDVDSLLSSVGTSEFKEEFIANLERMQS